jgi:hypothetical protein
MELTRGQIIAEGLSQAGRPDLLSNGRLWLNQFLEDQYENQDWRFLIKTAKGLTVSQGGDLPSDYRAAVSATVGPTVTNQSRLELVAADHFHELERINDNGGQPEFAWPDKLEKKIFYHPIPVGTYVYNLRYYHIPVLPSITDAGADNLEPVWDAPKGILIQAIYVKALEYNDDNRFPKEEQKLMKLVSDHKINSHDLRAGKHRLKWGKSFRPRRGRF